MLFPTFVRDANKTATTLMQAAFDNMRATQETMERQRELATKMEMPWKVSWSKGPMPMPATPLHQQTARAKPST